MIELLVVIAIIAVLMGILLSVMGKVREQARRVACAANLRSIGQGLHAYADSYDGLLPAQYDTVVFETYDTSADNIQPWISTVAATKARLDARGRLRPVQLGKLFTLGIVGDPRAFYCPSGERREFSSYGEFAYRYYRDPNTPRLPGNQLWSAPPGRRSESIMTGYMYWIHGERRLDALGRSTLVTDRIYLWSTIAHTGSGGRPEGLHGLFGDGHVRFCNDEWLFEENLWGLDGSAVPGARKAKFERILSRMGN